MEIYPRMKTGPSVIIGLDSFGNLRLKRPIIYYYYLSLFRNFEGYKLGIGTDIKTKILD